MESIFHYQSPNDQRKALFCGVQVKKRLRRHDSTCPIRSIHAAPIYLYIQVAECGWFANAELSGYLCRRNAWVVFNFIVDHPVEIWQTISLQYEWMGHGPNRLYEYFALRRQQLLLFETLIILYVESVPSRYPFSENDSSHKSKQNKRYWFCDCHNINTFESRAPPSEILICTNSYRVENYKMHSKNGCRIKSLNSLLFSIVIECWKEDNKICRNILLRRCRNDENNKLPKRAWVNTSHVRQQNVTSFWHIDRRKSEHTLECIHTICSSDVHVSQPNQLK